MKTRVASNAYLLWLCPGCKLVHQIKFGEGPGPTWVWNHNRERPSISPSVMVRRTIGEEYIETVCHCYVTDGIIQFLDDCTHSLKGQNVPIPDFPEYHEVSD